MCISIDAAPGTYQGLVASPFSSTPFRNPAVASIADYRVSSDTTNASKLGGSPFHRDLERALEINPNVHGLKRLPTLPTGERTAGTTHKFSCFIENGLYNRPSVVPFFLSQNTFTMFTYIVMMPPLQGGGAVSIVCMEGEAEYIAKATVVEVFFKGFRSSLSCDYFCNLMHLGLSAFATCTAAIVPIITATSIGYRLDCIFSRERIVRESILDGGIPSAVAVARRTLFRRRCCLYTLWLPTPSRDRRESRAINVLLLRLQRAHPWPTTSTPLCCSYRTYFQNSELGGREDATYGRHPSVRHLRLE